MAKINIKNSHIEQEFAGNLCISEMICQVLITEIYDMLNIFEEDLCTEKINY